MKNKKQLSFKESFMLSKRAYGLFCKRFPKVILLRIICVIWGALTPYVGVWLSARIINELSGARDKGMLTKLVLITLISSALISLITAILGKWRDTASAGLFFRIKHILSDKIMTMDFADADSARVHEMYNKIEENAASGGWGLSKVTAYVEALISAVLRIAGGITLTVSLFTAKIPDSAGGYTVLNNPLFIAVIVAAMLAVTYISPMLSAKAGRYYALNAGTHNLANKLFSFFGFLGRKRELAADVRMYRQDAICDKYMADKTSTFGSKGMFARLAKGPMGLLNAASSAVSVVFTGIVYAFVCLKALGGAFGIGSVTQYISSITMVSGGVSSLISNAGDMRNNASFLKLIFEYLGVPSKMQCGSLSIDKSEARRYEIEFRDVSFKYPGSDTYALKHVNMKFKTGSRVAVVGRNGSGKTTFIKLLCRLYDPDEGEILLNGINIKEYDYTEYLSVFSVVFQDFKLLSYPLGENVAADTVYNAEFVKECLVKSGFSDRLASLPEGMDTYLYKAVRNTGIDISKGEAQKIAIARALYKDAPFMILDEPTAALDPIAEAEIYENFNSIVGDKTAVYISHRLSSCRFCDEILVFEDGSIIQKGGHDALVSDTSGKYYELWTAQAQYYINDNN